MRRLLGGKSEIADSFLVFKADRDRQLYPVREIIIPPYRIPMYNDAERLRIFRTCALRGMIADGSIRGNAFETIHRLQLDGTDADPKHGKEYPWFSSYLSAGKSGLKGYLGTEKRLISPKSQK